MKATKEQKKTQAKGLAEELKRSSQVFFTEYQGLKFEDLFKLRKGLKPLRCKYRVIKNSLVLHALRDAGIEPESSRVLLTGPVGMVLGGDGDPISSAKALEAFSKQFPRFKFKAGYVGKRWLTSQECSRLSTLGSRPELLRRLAGTLYGALARIVWVLRAPMYDLVGTLRALETQRRSGPEASAQEAPAA